MAWRIVKQPNNLLARFSDVVDNFTHLNLTNQEALLVCKEEGLSTEISEKKVDAGINDYKPWTLNTKGSGLDRWNDCITTIKEVHGKDEAKRILNEIKKRKYNVK